MLKLITSAPDVLLASVIACLSEPAPVSLVLITVKVVEAWAGFTTSMSYAAIAASRKAMASSLPVVALFCVEVVIFL